MLHSRPGVDMGYRIYGIQNDVTPYYMSIHRLSHFTQIMQMYTVLATRAVSMPTMLMATPRQGSYSHPGYNTAPLRQSMAQLHLLSLAVPTDGGWNKT